MSNEKNKLKKWIIIILSIVLALAIAAGGTVWYFVSRKKQTDSDNKKGVVIITEEELLEEEDVPDDVLEDLDIEPDLDDEPGSENKPNLDILDEEDYDEEETEYLLSILNSKSVNNNFIGFGAVYYPWLFWEDSLGRNYTDKQIQIELDRLVESGTTWIRSVIYARPEWYNSANDEWRYSGGHYEGLVKFFKEIDKRGIEVMLNFEWGESIQDTFGVFSNATLKAYPTEKKIKMYGDFCTTFTKALKAEGINCVKYLTFFSEPSNRKEQGMLYDTEEFDEVHVKKIVPFYTNLVKSVHDAFSEAGIRKDYKFIGNNQASAYELNMYSWQQFKPMYDAAKEYLDEYSYHFYNYVSNPKGETYDDYAYLVNMFVEDVEKNLGVKANNTWFDEINVAYNGTEGPIYDIYKKYGTGIYALKDEPYTATQLSNTLISLLNGGYKTAALWTFTSNLWPDSTQTGGSFGNGVFLCGVMPNLMESQVPYNTYYTYSLISRYCNNAKKIYAGDNFYADSMATSCVYDKDGNVTVYVVNSNLYDVKYKLEFEVPLDKKVMYRHLYDPQTFESDTSAKPIGVDRVLVNVSGGIVDTIPAGAVAVYTTSKK